MIEVVGMVYRGEEFVKFLDKQLWKDHYRTYRIIGNDADKACLDYLYNMDDVDSWYDYHDPNPEDHYLSRVYRCWNYCVESSKAEYVCLVNSDMAFSPGWLEALERRLDGRTLPCSRLVEPGFIGVGKHAAQIDLGRNPVTFPWDSWQRVVSDLTENRTEPGGLFMPCVLHRETFLNVGGYPEGNVTIPGLGRTINLKSGESSPTPPTVISGDAFLFGKMALEGFEHVTCFDSLVYHMQEGEMRPEP